MEPATAIVAETAPGESDATTTARAVATALAAGKHADGLVHVVAGEEHPAEEAAHVRFQLFGRILGEPLHHVEVAAVEILAVVLGAAVYQYTISSFLVKNASYILRLVTLAVKKLFFPACLCIKWLKNHLKRGRISMYGHLKRFGKRKKDRGERKNNGESRA